MKRLQTTLALLLAWSLAAEATPLSLEYYVRSVGTSAQPLYRYFFTLTLDNNDGSWRPGQRFDEIVFADAPAVPLLPDFRLDPGQPPVGPFKLFGKVSGAHNGPALFSLDGGGWTPDGPGATLRWSGTASRLIEPQALRFSTLAGSGTAAQFAPARETSGPDPAPPRRP